VHDQWNRDSILFANGYNIHQWHSMRVICAIEGRARNCPIWLLHSSKAVDYNLKFPYIIRRTSITKEAQCVTCQTSGDTVPCPS
jgi:hypothetical protein